MQEPIPLFDCRLDTAARSVVEPVLASGALAYGPFVDELEARIAAYLDGRASVAMSNLTQAIAMALRLSGVGPGDEVLTLALNCMASNAAIPMTGAAPAWVDIDPATLTINLEDCRRALTARTKALVAYHVSGYPADVAAIEHFCVEHGLVFIEDANNALGARAGSRKIGAAGRFSVLSFYANRQVNGIEGAALVCVDPEDAERARRLRKYGVDTTRFRDAEGEIRDDTDVTEIGVSALMNHVNARLACYHMESLDERIASVRNNASVLREALAGTNIEPIEWKDADAPAFWTFLVRSPKRDALMEFLKAQSIHCSRLHQRNDRYSGFATPPHILPGTERFEREALALPCGWWLAPRQLEVITEALHRWSLGKV